MEWDKKMLSVYPLANPKGVRLQCELCQAPAFLQCPDCRVTYYCSAEHQRSDFESIHLLLCPLLVPLRVPQPVMSNEEERRRSEEQSTQLRLHLLKLTRKEAARLLATGRPDQALPAAVHSLRFSIALYGLRSLELVHSYLLLAESSIGLGQVLQAEEYLSEAQWTVLKNPDCSPILLAKVHRDHGMLYTAKGNHGEALTQLANYVYYSSCVYGTNHVRTSPGYFYMANVFLQQKKTDTAASLYTEVTEAWHQFLSRMIQGGFYTPREDYQAPRRPGGTEELHIEEDQATEALQMLNEIAEIRESLFKRDPAKLAHTLHTLAMLHFVLSDFPKACQVAKKALLIINESPNREGAETIAAFLAMAESKLPPCK